MVNNLIRKRLHQINNPIQQKQPTRIQVIDTGDKKDLLFGFGKFAGLKASDIACEDIKYLVWVYQEMEIDERIKKILYKIIQHNMDQHSMMALHGDDFDEGPYFGEER